MSFREEGGYSISTNVYFQDKNHFIAILVNVDQSVVGTVYYCMH